MSALTGTGPMLALTARRERVHAPAWYGLAALLLVAVGAGIIATYPTEAARAELARTVNTNAGELFLIGPMAGTGIGGLVLWRTQGIAAILIGLAAILVVTRNTRTAEEDGTLELSGAAAIGRAAPLGAALAVAAAGSLAAGLIVASGFSALGAATVGSALAGGQVLTTGLLFAGIAAVTGQIVRTGRGAASLSVAVLAALYLVRGAVDASGAAVRISPLGWIAAVRPFADNDILALVPALALAGALSVLGLRIAARRDLGAGLFSERAGSAHASAWLRGPLSLALRVNRGTIIGWSSGAAFVGLLIGTLAATVNEQVDLELGDAGGLAPVALYLAPEIITVLGLTTILRLGGDVASGRAEALLAQSVRRSHWLLAHTAGAVTATLSALLAFGLGLGIAHAQATGEPAQVAVWTWAALVRAPAAWVLIAIVAALLATAPRFAAATGFTLLALLLGLELGVELGILAPEAFYASPFALVPQLPHGPGHFVFTALLLLLTVALTALGARRIRHVDIDQCYSNGSFSPATSGETR